MDKLAFLPIIDIPLAGVTLGIFIWHFNKWSLRRNVDTNVDLVSRLPQARIRVIALFVGLLLLCWSVNLAFWSLLAGLLALGLAITFALGGDDLEGGAFGLLAVAFVIREWAFGFPQLILHPQRHTSNKDEDRVEFAELVGQTGVASSPLRPSGDAEFGGVKYSVVSYDGGLIDVGSTVVVRSVQNGRICVAPSADVGSSYGP